MTSLYLRSFYLWVCGYIILQVLNWLDEMALDSPVTNNSLAIGPVTQLTTTGAPNASDNILFKYECSVAQFVERYIITTLFFVSITGNSFIIAVFCTKNYRNNLTAALFQILAVTDGIVVLIQDGLHHISVVTTDRSLLTYNEISCKSFGFILIWLRTFSIWLVAAITAERLICVLLPHKIKSINTKRNYTWFILATNIFICCLYVPLVSIISHTQAHINGRSMGECILATGELDIDAGMTWNLVYAGIIFLVTSLLPACFIVTSNIIIIRGLKKRRHSGARPSRLHDNVVTLLWLSSTAVVLTLPLPIYILLRVHIKDPETVAFNSKMTFKYFIPVFDSLHRSINILFFAAFGRKFRQSARNLFYSIINRNESIESFTADR